jgi:hypothetical protein
MGKVNATCIIPPPRLSPLVEEHAVHCQSQVRFRRGAARRRRPAHERHLYVSALSHRAAEQGFARVKALRRREVAVQAAM